MKKLVLIIITLFFITGCSNENYIELEDNGGMDGITYKFVGDSNTFTIATGNIFYEDVKKQLLISNFKSKKEIIADKMTILLLINSKEYRKIEYNKDMNITPKEFLNNVFITDFTLLSRDSESLFSKTTKKDIKDDLEIHIETCLNNTCENEKIKLDYFR